MRYALNQAGFPLDRFEQNCQVVSNAGYDGIEPNYREGKPISTESGRASMRDAVERHELDVPAVSTTLHWEFPLSSPDDSVRNRGLDIGFEMIDAASTLSAEAVLIVPAVIEPGSHYESHYERALSSVHELVEYSHGTGITVTIENVQNNFLYAPDELRTFVEQSRDAGPVSVYFDIGNGFRDGLPDRWIRELGSNISKVHIKDWVTDAHQVAYPLQGDIDWDAVVEALDDIDYDGWMTAEVPSYQSSPERMPAQVLENIRFLFEANGRY